MSVCLTVTLNSYTFDRLSSEVTWIDATLDTVVKEITQQRGNKTSGNIIGQAPNGTANTSLGSWTYTASATKA